MLQGITEEVKKQAEQRINSRFIMYVLGIHDLALEKPKGVDVVDTLQKAKKKLERARDYLDSAKKKTCGTTVERSLEDEKYQMLVHEQGYTQSDKE